MGNDLTKRTLSTDLTVASTQGELAKHANSREVEAIQNRTVQDLARQQGEASKAMHAAKLAADIRNFGHATSDRLMQDIYGRNAEQGRTAPHQARLEALTERLLDDHENEVSAIAHLGATRVAQIASEPISPPPEKKKWWE